MTTVRYTGPSKAAIAAILNKPEIRAALAAEAERGKVFAEADAATFSNADDPDSYASKFEVGEGRMTIKGIERPTGTLTNTSGYAASVEWGKGGTAASPGQSAHHTLARTAEFLGEGT